MVIRKQLSILNSLSRALKIADMPEFPPGKIDKGFRMWAEKGLITVDQLFVGETLKSYENLQKEFCLSGKCDIFCRHMLIGN